MHRRTFLGSLLASAAAKFLVLTEGDSGVAVAKNRQIPDPPPVTLHFGDLSLLSGQEADLSISNPFHRCPYTGLHQFARMTDVRVNRLVGPRAVWEQILTAYADVRRAKDNPPVLVKLGDKTLCTLEHALFQQIGWSVTSQDVVVVDNASLAGRWKELHDALERYNEAAQEEAAFYDKTLGEKHAPAKDAHWCEDCTDFHD